MAPASSCAIARGAFRSVRASWNATVTARSPRVRLGGTSIAKGECRRGRTDWRIAASNGVVYLSLKDSES